MLVSFLAHFLTLKKGAACSFEKWGDFQLSTLRYMSEVLLLGFVKLKKGKTVECWKVLNGDFRVATASVLYYKCRVLSYKKTKFRGLVPRASCTDRATAHCRRS
jgi:hypothetical protein